MTFECVSRVCFRGEMFKAVNILASMLPHAWRLVVPIKVLLFCLKISESYAPENQVRKLGTIG